MELLPAIDLRNGVCVRLLQGDYDRQIDYGHDPVAQARDFETAGAKWLHVVDLDGAKEGRPVNLSVLERIRMGTGLHIELGGGIRTEETIRTYLDTGVNRVIIGTAALESPEWFKEMVHRYPGRIVLGLDARDGHIATHGWTQTDTMTALEMARDLTGWPLAAIVYTDIACDGMLTGPNVEATHQLAQATKVPVIASGGIGSLAHIEQLAAIPIWGMIAGRALYEGAFRVEQALAKLPK